MIEIRIHGRGGQGAVVASKVLAKAAFLNNHYVQSFPQYGVERRGAPVEAFARIASHDETLIIRQDIYEPDHLIILDATLLTSIDVITGLKKGGWIVINTSDSPHDLCILPNYKLATVNARDIAIKHSLGSAACPIVNTAILGAFIKVTKITNLELLTTAIEDEIHIKPDANKIAAEEAYHNVIIRGEHV
jgi:2-oxoisovalerate ferredoxin oxidoreductase gamma subunit